MFTHPQVCDRYARARVCDARRSGGETFRDQKEEETRLTPSAPDQFRRLNHLDDLGGFRCASHTPGAGG
eukprot:scaffold127614_cov33-Phaeocystis_antarctica.AAC.1